MAEIGSILEAARDSGSRWEILFSSRLIECLLPALIILILSGCAGTPEIKPIAQPKETLINYALSLQGAPYRYGKESPREGFDCSGFVRHVYGRHGIWLPRTVKEMAAYLPSITKDDLHSGDLVLFNTSGTHYFSISAFLLITANSFMLPAAGPGKCWCPALIIPIGASILPARAAPEDAINLSYCSG